MELQVGVKALIKDNEGRYLMLRRTYPYAGEKDTRWGIPGGRINPGEPILEALAREIKEETHLTLKGSPKLLYAQDILRIKDTHVVRLTYEAEVEPGEVNPVDDDPAKTGHNEFRWVEASEIKNLLHDKYLTPVFELLGIEPNKA